MGLFSSKKKGLSWQAEEEIVVPFKHLPENVQNLIKTPDEIQPFIDVITLRPVLRKSLSPDLRSATKGMSIRELRAVRGMNELFLLENGVEMLRDLKSSKFNGLMSSELLLRQVVVFLIQKQCSSVLSKIQSSGVVSREHIDEYPFGFAKPFD
ncbi:MAG: hypothetical protein WCI04_07220 [archaeon]